MWRSRNALGLAGAIRDSECAGDAERIEAVQIATGRQDRRGAQHVAAGCRADEPAVECAQEGGNFPWSRAINASVVGEVTQAQSLWRRPKAVPRAPAPFSGVVPATTASATDRSSLRPCPASAAARQHVGAFLGRWRLAHHMQKP